jgi:hypothetical protein
MSHHPVATGTLFRYSRQRTSFSKVTASDQGDNMNLRFLEVMKHSLMAIVAAVMLPVSVWADGPSYTYTGISYEWTDVKYGINPSEDPNFNEGDFNGANLDASIGILPWLHVVGQYFTGSCSDCGTYDNGNTFDIDFDGYELGLGYNQSLEFLSEGWKDTDLVLRAYYLDVDFDNVADDDGYQLEGQINSQISEKAEVQIGYRYQNVNNGSASNVKNRDMTVGLIYRVWDGVALSARGIVFDDDTGFDLGIRWYFGDLLFDEGRDSIVR